MIFSYFSEWVDVGRIFLEYGYEDLQQQLKEYMDRIQSYKEQLVMKQFQERNGFEATDDEAKRALIDEMCHTLQHPLPATDEERNQIIESDSSLWMEMMKVGWRPRISV